MHIHTSLTKLFLLLLVLVSVAVMSVCRLALHLSVRSNGVLNHRQFDCFLHQLILTNIKGNITAFLTAEIMISWVNEPPAIRLIFFQQLIQTNIKENITAFLPAEIMISWVIDTRVQFKLKLGISGIIMEIKASRHDWIHGKLQRGSHAPPDVTTKYQALYWRNVHTFSVFVMPIMKAKSEHSCRKKNEIHSPRLPKLTV